MSSFLSKTKECTRKMFEWYRDQLERQETMSMLVKRKKERWLLIAWLPTCLSWSLFESNKWTEWNETHKDVEWILDIFIELKERKWKWQTFSWDKIEKFEQFSLNTRIQFNYINTSGNIRFTWIRLKHQEQSSISSLIFLLNMYHWDAKVSLEVYWTLTYLSIVEERLLLTFVCVCVDWFFSVE